MSIYYADDRIQLHHGPSAPILSTLPSGSVDCVITSPPYFGLRSYLPADHPDKQWEIGTEATPAEYVDKLTALFGEVRRVLADDGTFWLNLGDSYTGAANMSGLRRKPGAPKNLLGMPWRVALALQDSGWTLRNDIIWQKPNTMPDPARDRFSSKHEYMFLLSKGPRYWFDLDAVKVPSQAADPGHAQRYAKRYESFDARAAGSGQPGNVNNAGVHSRPGNGMVNPGDVWKISTTPFKGAHFAAFPPKLVERCILAGCKPGGIVLDPFHGSGTTGKVALENGRRYVGVELNREYLDLSMRTRLAGHVEQVA